MSKLTHPVCRRRAAAASCPAQPRHLPPPVRSLALVGPAAAKAPLVEHASRALLLPLRARPRRRSPSSRTGRCRSATPAPASSASRRTQVYGLLESQLPAQGQRRARAEHPDRQLRRPARHVRHRHGLLQGCSARPRDGWLKSMHEAGIEPADRSTTIVCSHAHIDHTGGICSGRRQAAIFPNAPHPYQPARLSTYWTDEDAKLGTPLKAFGEHARANLRPVRDRIVFFKDRPGVPARRAPRSRRPATAAGHHDLQRRLGRQILHLPRRPHPPRRCC
jgi:hypothetical protein